MNQDPPANTPAGAPTQPTLPAQSNRRKIILLVAVMSIIAIGVALAVVLPKKPSGPGAQTANTTAVEKLFYDTLGNAAAQPVLRLGMYRATFPDRAAADAATNPASEASTVSEVDVPSGDYRSLYAYRLSGESAFTLGRCLTGKDHRDARSGPARPTTLKAAAGSLDRIVPTGADLPFSPCPRLGVYPAGSPDHAAARLSDGIFPVTLTKDQAAAWTAKMKATALFDIKDEGTLTKDGKTLRKLSFTPKPDVTKVNQTLYNIFYETGEIDKIKAMNNPKAQFLYEFISVGVVNHGDVAGYYLIDEAKQLPVYSELKGLAEDQTTAKSGDAAGNNLARTKQYYSFGEPLKLNTLSPLDFVQ